MDIKIDGITEQIFEVALEKAHKARSHILENMNSILLNEILYFTETFW